MMKIRDRLLRKMKKIDLGIIVKFIEYSELEYQTNFQTMNKLWSAIKSIISNKSCTSSCITKKKEWSNDIRSI